MANKNIRMSFQAWRELRNLKFDTGKGSYTEVFLMIFDTLNKGKTSVEDFIISKKPSDDGMMHHSDISKDDKTIVIDSDIHEKLLSYKTMYMREHDVTARGPGAISISQIIMVLISKYREIAAA
jgi:predicted CopG family antitoxin